MTAKPIQVGLFSTAHLHAESYASVLKSIDDAELVGVTDKQADRGRSFAKTYDLDFFDPDTLLSAVDCVIVCSTNADHTQWIERAADAGVDILSEKPLAPRVDTARDLVETCEAAGVHLGVAMPLRFSVPARHAKSSFEAGDLGTLEAIVGTNRGKMPGDWFVDPAASGGGAVMDHTVHLVDLVHWLTGERVAEVYAETENRFHDLAVEDVNLLSMELTDGTQFSLDGSWSRPENWEFWGDATVSLFGTEATIDVDCFAQTLEHTAVNSDGGGRNAVYWGTDPNTGMLEDFIDAVREEHEPETTGREGVEAVAVVQAAYESAAEGKPVAVDY